ncbi:heterokaryon incompatibility protein-domain-containing protein [Earliella scabrosa]|nr:heterokaryon incompatibility protein-domain-containing protein [Earliella scabrosa]
MIRRSLAMWLLSTDRAELHYFADHLAVDGGYAILSHTWGPDEQSFQDLQALRAWCRRAIRKRNPRDRVSQKIRQSCILAEAAGYKWIWIDTCCIDKTSSAELSEGINSMFRWYSSAEVCYAFLEDVPTPSHRWELYDFHSSFRNARWHTRGWTLQELIAPQVVTFVSQSWEAFSDKVELSFLLSDITGIDEGVLTRKVRYDAVSIAERMYWASRRQTTRVEDEAYCLMGLFNINMPTIYGEGRAAFQRLQQEIMKSTFDTSLFVWGAWQPDCSDPSSWLPVKNNNKFIEHTGPLAVSPTNFLLNHSGVRFSPALSDPLQPYLPSQWKLEGPEAADHDLRSSGPFGAIELPHFTITNYGLQCRFPIIEADEVTIAVLLCQTANAHLGLLLHPSPTPLLDPTRKTYRVGYTFQQGARTSGMRIIDLGRDYSRIHLNGRHYTAEWRDICIESDARAQHRDPISQIGAINCISRHPPFRVPLWLINGLSVLGLELREPYVFRDKPMHVAILCEHTGPGQSEAIWFCLGTCAARHPKREHWAKVLLFHAENWYNAPDFEHVCADDHVGNWPNWAKTFGDADRTIRVSFSPSNGRLLTNVTTLVMHVELEGRAYTEMSRRRKVDLPREIIPSTTEDAEESHAELRKVASAQRIISSEHPRRSHRRYYFSCSHSAEVPWSRLEEK